MKLMNNLTGQALYKYYVNSGEFEPNALDEIKLGVEQGLDVSCYASPEFDYCQMYQIRTGLRDGIDVSIYAKPEYNSFQMQELRDCLTEGLDVNELLTPNMTYGDMLKKMNELRFKRDCPPEKYDEYWAHVSNRREGWEDILIEVYQ
jgi:hypothetical protein